MTIWTPQIDLGEGSLADRIASAVVEAVRSGRLRPGDALPPQRALAERLGVSLDTVGRAYKSAIARGAARGEVGRGTFVVGSPSDGPAVSAWGGGVGLERPRSGPIDLARNLPTPGPADRALKTAFADLASDPRAARFLDAADPADARRRADAAAALIARGGGPSDPARIVETVGAQQALCAALVALTAPGDAVLVEAMAYPGVLALLRKLGRKPAPIALDAEGARPDALDAAARRKTARIAILTPTLQSPTAATAGADRRAALIAAAERRDLTIVEDDVFGFLEPHGAAPLAALAPERVVYIASASKRFGPGLRVGWASAPRALAPALRDAVATLCWSTPPLTSELAARWIASGEAERCEAAQFAEAAARRRLIQDALPERAVDAAGGFHVWIRTPPEWPDGAFAATAAAAGVLVADGRQFAADPSVGGGGHVRACLSHEPDRTRVEEGLARLRALLDRGPADPALV